MSDESRDEHKTEPKDELPKDLDVTQYVGPYIFPNITRRRIPGAMYVALALLCFGGFMYSGNGGLLAAAIILGLIAAYHFAAAWELAVDQTQALVVATRTVGFPVGHASAQLDGHPARAGSCCLAMRSKRCDGTGS